MYLLVSGQQDILGKQNQVEKKYFPFKSVTSKPDKTQNIVYNTKRLHHEFGK